MIPVSDELRKAITTGSFQPGYVADLVVDGQVVLPDVPLAQCELVADAEAKVMTQGTATFTYSDAMGKSIVPEDITSWLTPFASFLDVSYRVALDDGFVAKVLRGHMKIVGVADPKERNMWFHDRLLTVSSSVRLKLADVFVTTDRERFATPSGPKVLTSTWNEIALLTGLALDKKGIADAAIARKIVYEENRLDAVRDLADILGGRPYVTPGGAIAVRPYAWPAESMTLQTGPEGTVELAEANDLTSDGIYNQVVVRSWDDTQQGTVLATAEVPDGPLRYGGPFGRIPYFAASQLVTTKPQAQVYADSLLPTVSSLPAVKFTVQCAPDPRIEVGDVVNFIPDYRGEEMTGRVVKITLPGSGNMTLVVEVRRAI